MMTSYYCFCFLNSIPHQHDDRTIIFWKSYKVFETDGACDVQYPKTWPKILSKLATFLGIHILC